MRRLQLEKQSVRGHSIGVLAVESVSPRNRAYTGLIGCGGAGTYPKRDTPLLRGRSNLRRGFALWSAVTIKVVKSRTNGIVTLIPSDVARAVATERRLGHVPRGKTHGACFDTHSQGWMFIFACVALGRAYLSRVFHLFITLSRRGTNFQLNTGNVISKLPPFLAMMLTYNTRWQNIILLNIKRYC